MIAAGVVDQPGDQRVLGGGVVPHAHRLSRRRRSRGRRRRRSAASGTTRRTRRIADTSWVTVSWVATASSSSVESNARRRLPANTPVASIDLAHRVEDPLRPFGLPQPGAPIGEHRVVEALVVEGQPGGDLPRDVGAQRRRRVPIRQALERLQHHHRRDHISRAPTAGPDPTGTDPRTTRRGTARGGDQPRTRAPSRSATR